MMNHPSTRPTRAPGVNNIADCRVKNDDWPSASGNGNLGPSQTVKRPPQRPNIHQGKASRRGPCCLRPLACLAAADDGARASSALKITTAREGVMVMALTAEIIVETAMVTANWRKNWPVMPPRKQQGIKTELKTRV